MHAFRDLRPVWAGTPQAKIILIVMSNSECLNANNERVQYDRLAFRGKLLDLLPVPY